MKTAAGALVLTATFAAAVAGPVAGAEAPASGVERTGAPSWIEEVERPPASLPAGTPRLAPLLARPGGEPITDAAAWERERARLRGLWLDFLGRYPEDRGPVKLETLDEDRPAGCVRRLVRYETEPGVPVEAYLILPEKVEGKLPAVAVFHSTDDATIRQPAGLSGDPSKHFGLSLARRGFATLSPRCYLWEASDRDYLAAVKRAAGRHPGTKGMARMLHDARRAVDVLVSLPEVDAGRIGAIGHSLGAKEVLFLAAFDGRVRAAVSSEGGVGLSFSNWEAPWYLGPGIRETGFPLESHQVLALVPPRAFLLIGGGDSDGAHSWPFIAAVLPVYDLLGVPRRLGLLDHGKGHSVPPIAETRAYEWLECFLAPAGARPAATGASR